MSATNPILHDTASGTVMNIVAEEGECAPDQNVSASDYI